MIVLNNTGGIAETNCFLIGDEATKQAVLFDAPDHTVEPLLDEVENRGWALIGLWLTHGHFDHFADHAVVRQRFPAVKIAAHALELPKLREPAVQTRLFGIPLVIQPCEPDFQVMNGQKLRLGISRSCGSPHTRPLTGTCGLLFPERGNAGRRRPHHWRFGRPNRPAGFKSAPDGGIAKKSDGSAGRNPPARRPRDPEHLGRRAPHQPVLGRRALELDLFQESKALRDLFFGPGRFVLDEIVFHASLFRGLENCGHVH